ncbi:MAG: hypothetical protein A2Z83_04050 [Omnitrophica bacterium GWA2_52_8]|nr:MAG: hypothetical protein A2Z83_04050 [Omnitrophica bacterium GWA2_52_8]
MDSPKFNIQSRLIIGFLCLTVFMTIVGFFSIQSWKRIEPMLTVMIPQGLASIEKTSALDALAQELRDQDAGLTKLIQRYLTTQDLTWREDYDRIEKRLSDLLVQAIRKGDLEEKEIFSKARKARDGYVKIEKMAIDLIDRMQVKEANQQLESKSYWMLKGDFKKALEEYTQKRGKKLGDRLVVTSAHVEGMVQNTRLTLERTIQGIVVICVLGLIFAIASGMYIAKTILTPLRQLLEGVHVVRGGNLTHQIKVQSRDEFQVVAQGFNAMTDALCASYAGLEQKVHEKTKDLAAAKHQIELKKVHLETLVKNMGEAMIATDELGNISMMNQQAEVLLGYNRENSVGRPFHEVIQMQDEYGKVVPFAQYPIAVAHALKKRVSAKGYYLKQDGFKVYVSTTASPVVRDGNVVSVIETFRDFSHEKKVDHLKTQLISLVSHEFCTPLTVIREGVSLVVDGTLGGVNPAQERFLKTAISEVDRLTSLVHELLDVSRIEAGQLKLKPEMVDIGKLIQEAAEPFRYRALQLGVELRVQTEPQPVQVFVDFPRMKQVFINLMSNAFKFTKKGFVEVGFRQIGSDIEAYVADSGEGIPEEKQKRLFDKYEQLSDYRKSGVQGTGLGLVIAKGIVESHHGRMEVSSQFGKGTTFKFIFPKLNENMKELRIA